MSRTRKGTKTPGYEYWGKRPGGAMPPGRISKKITHKAERRQARKETTHVPND